MDFYRYYLKYDCLTLKYGFETHRKKMMEITKLDIHDYLTISSLSYNYMINKGVYKDVYKVCGGLQHFISKWEEGQPYKITKFKELMI